MDTIVQKFCIFVITLCLGFPAFANAETKTYKLRQCPFHISLPSKPLVSYECAEQVPEKCVSFMEFTKVHIGQATIEITIRCAPSKKEDYERFSAMELKASLEENAKVSGIEQIRSHTNKNNETKVKYATLTGLRPSSHNHLEAVIMNRAWITPDYLVSFQASLSGKSSKEVDEEFSRIIQSAQLETE